MRPHHLWCKMIFDDPEFKQEFWRWFDSISSKEKQKFHDYPADMAELYFYNKIYRIRPQHVNKTANSMSM